MTHLYDEIGKGYGAYRLPDPSIDAAIHCALGNIDSLVNVGAGAGSYEPASVKVTAVEPSTTMIQQRNAHSAPVARGCATALPFADASFDAGLAVLSLHHWKNQTKGLLELIRVVRGPIVIMTWDPGHADFWLTDDYFPEILHIDNDIFMTMDQLGAILGEVSVHPVMIPHDCRDGFLSAYWRRPSAYLDARIRNSISTFSKLTHAEKGFDRLRSDLEDGTWQRKYGSLLDLDQLDLGYRLVVRP